VLALQDQEQVLALKAQHKVLVQQLTLQAQVQDQEPILTLQMQAQSQ
jgi:hypothetical protein